MCLTEEFFIEREKWLADRRIAGETPLDEWLETHGHNEAQLIAAGLLVAKEDVSTADLTHYTTTQTSQRWLRHTCSFDTILVRRNKSHLLLEALRPVSSH